MLPTKIYVEVYEVTNTSAVTLFTVFPRDLCQTDFWDIDAIK